MEKFFQQNEYHTNEDSVNMEIMSENAKENLIRSSNTFEKLYRALTGIGSIQGSQEVFESEQLIDKIERVRKKVITIDYITRACGLRETVERLLQESREPVPPPSHFEAVVEMELPKEDVHEKPKAFAQITNSPENSPIEPIEPLTDEEEEFCYAAHESERFSAELGTLYEMNIEANPKRFFDMNNPKVIGRYEQLKEKSRKYREITHPASFEKLKEALTGASGVRDNKGTNLDVQEALRTIEDVRAGRVSSNDLPEILRYGVERLIADNVVERMQKAGESPVRIEDYEWKIFVAQFPHKDDFLSRGWISMQARLRWKEDGEYPVIGAKNLHTKSAPVGGEFVWSDGEKMIFKTGHEFFSILVEDIVIAYGKTFGELESEYIEEEKMHRRGSSENQKALYVGE